MNKREVLNILTRSKVALDKSCSTLGADCAVVRNGKMYNTNERLAIVQPFTSESFSVNGDALLTAIRSIKGEDVDIVVSPKDIIVRGGKTRVKLIQTEEQISSRIASIQPQEPSWNKLPESFLKALDLVLVSTIDKKLNGVFFNGEYIYSSDGWQINRILIDANFDPLWLSQKNVTDIMSFGALDEYTTEHSWLHMKKEDTFFSCRKLDHTGYPLPLLEKTIARFEDIEIVTINDSEVIFDLWESIKAAVNLTDTGKITLQISDGELFVDAACASGEYSDILDVAIESMPVFTVFAKKAIDVLAKPGISSVSFRSNGSRKAMVASGVDYGIEWLSLLSAE